MAAVRPLSAISSVGCLTSICPATERGEGKRDKDTREMGEGIGTDLAAVAALFVSLMSVRVPHSRPEKHEYNKMKMKDT